jgi:ribosome-associated protein
MQTTNPMLDILLKSLDDSQASDITTIDVREHTTITDFMIICSGRSSRHIRAIAEQMIDTMKSAGLPSLGHTGFESGDWALVDFGDFVVHVMQPESRAFYNLEGLWQNQPQ